MAGKPVYLWKSLKKGMVSDHKNFKWQLNKWYKTDDELEMCSTGFHASVNLLDAMQFVGCEVIAKVEVRGEKLIQQNKQCWSEMRIVKKWIWTKEDSVKLAVYSAKSTLKNFEKYFPDDKRPRQAIQAAENGLKSCDDSAAKTASAAKAASAAWSATKLAWSGAKLPATGLAALASWSATWSATSLVLRLTAEPATAGATGSTRWIAWSVAWSAKETAESIEGLSEWTEARPSCLTNIHNWIVKLLNSQK